MEQNNFTSSANNFNSNTNKDDDNNGGTRKPVPTALFLTQLLGGRFDSATTPRYTATAALDSTGDVSHNTGDITSHPRESSDTTAPPTTTASTPNRKRARDHTAREDHTPAPKRVKAQNRFLRTAAEELDGPISNAVPWSGVEVTRVRVQVSLLALQLPIYRKYFGTSVAPRYELLSAKQRSELTQQACQTLTCTVEWANDTRQRTQDELWQITPRDSAQSTSAVTLVTRSLTLVQNGNDWLLEGVFAGFRARLRGPLRVRLSRANATGEHVLLDVTVSDTCWHQSVAPFTLEHTTRHVTLTELGNLARYYHEPSESHCLTLAADTSVTPATPRLELTFLAVSQMTELLRYVKYLQRLLQHSRANFRRSAGQWLDDTTPSRDTSADTTENSVLNELADLI